MIQIATGAKLYTGTGSPEGIVTGSVGDAYYRTDGAAGTTYYVKEVGNATNTGWTAMVTGVPVTGIANAMTYFGVSGAVTSNASLLIGSVDPFGRPRIWDFRTGGAGTIFRQGSWTADGDPTDVEGDGAAFIGKNINGDLTGSALGGAYARIKKDRFGLFQIIPGFPSGFYMARLDCDATAGGGGLTLRDDTSTVTVRSNRKTGYSFNKRLSVGTDSDPAVNGRIVASEDVRAGGNVQAAQTSYFYLGDATTDGSWRFYINAGDLVFEKRESGSWVEKGAFTA